MQDEILYTPEEVAKKLKLSKYTIYEMIKRGDISAYRMGRSLRISEVQLNQYLTSNTSAGNVYDATIINDGHSKFALTNNDVRISISTELEGDVKISIDPEDIILGTSFFVSSARNIFRGTVKSIMKDGKTAKVILDVGIPMAALITNQSLLDMDIKEGDPLYAIFKTMSVKVMPR